MKLLQLEYFAAGNPAKSIDSDNLPIRGLLEAVGSCGNGHCNRISRIRPLIFCSRKLEKWLNF